MRRVISFLSFILGSTCLLGQGLDLDELDCDSLNRLVEIILEEDLYERQSYQAQVPTLRRVLEAKACDGMAGLMVLEGIQYYNQKNTLAAKSILLQADSILRLQYQETPIYILTQLWLGLNDLQSAGFESAKLHLDKALRLSQHIQYGKGIFQAYLNFGTAYINQEQFDLAEDYLKKAVAINEEIGEQLWIGYAYLNLSRIAVSRKDYMQAIAYNQQAEQFWNTRQYDKGLYYVHLHYGAIYSRMGEEAQRIQNLEKALQFAEQEQAITPHHTYAILGYHYLEQAQNPAKAADFFEKALATSQFVDGAKVSELYTILFGIYEAQRDLPAIKRINSILLEVMQSKAALAQVEAKKWQDKELLLERQIKENKLLLESKLESELQLERRNWILFFLALLMGGAACLAYIQYRSNKLKKGLLEEIKDQKRTILRTQDQLIVQEKLASLGQLTAGIAHELKNPLNFINNFGEGSLELIEDLQEDMQAIRDKVDPAAWENLMEQIEDIRLNAKDIKENGLRADRIINSMMEHTRSTSSDTLWQQVDIHQLLDENANLAYHSYRAMKPNFAVSIQKAYGQAIPSVELISSKIGRVLLNLLNNACFAVHKKQQSLSSYDPIIKLTSRTDEQFLILSIWDNGVGIPKSVQREIFTPFFTTKPPGTGNTGLGLSISYDIIVKEHNGKIKVESEEGQFTCFYIHLPLERGGDWED
ncbi:MAG: ATP-binding protein [Bacteroidota bacterium]